MRINYIFHFIYLEPNQTILIWLTNNKLRSILRNYSFKYLSINFNIYDLSINLNIYIGMFNEVL